MSNIEQQVGYITGVLEEVRKDGKETREEILREFTKLYEQLGTHMGDDKERFKEMGKQIEELRTFQNKQRWWVAGAAGIVTVAATTVAFAGKVKLMVAGLFG